MNTNELFDRALASARELQRNLGDAAAKGTEQMKPLLEQSLKNAQDLQATLSKHAQESGVIAQAHTERALGHLQEFIRIGGEAVRASSAQAREYATQMAEQSRQAAQSVADAMAGKRGGDAPPPPENPPPPPQG